MYQSWECFEARWLVLFCASEFQLKIFFFFRVHWICSDWVSGTTLGTSCKYRDSEDIVPISRSSRMDTNTAVSGERSLVLIFVIRSGKQFYHSSGTCFHPLLTLARTPTPTVPLLETYLIDKAFRCLLDCLSHTELWQC